MKKNNFSTVSDGKSIEKLMNSELANMINSVPNVMDEKGKTGPESIKAFEKLAAIASTNDVILNNIFGKELLSSGLISGYKKEADFGNGLTRRTDLLYNTNVGIFAWNLCGEKKQQELL